MISLASLSAFSTPSATAPVAGTAATGRTGHVHKARAQVPSPAATTQSAAPALPNPGDKKLPRGSLLDLRV